MNSDPNKLMTQIEAAAYLGIMPQTLAVWRCMNRYPGLRFVKVGRSIRYRQSDLDRWLASRTVGATAEGE